MVVPNAVQSAPILIVDDEPANVRVLERLLERAGYIDVRSTTHADQVLQLCRERLPDLLLLDLHMPQLNGVELMRLLREQHGIDFPQVLILTGDASPEAKARALSGGARDFLPKPYDITEAILRIHNLLDLRLLHRQLRAKNDELEERVRERTHELEDARMEIIERLGKAAEFRDDATGQHTARVGRSAAMLASAIGLPQNQVDLICHAAPLHDVGKIAIPDHILLKPGPLTDDEMTIMRTHAEIGARLLSQSRSPLLHVAQEIAISHHERWNGAGYPRGLSTVSIPLTGRIVALSDFFDALIHDRPYRKRFPKDTVKVMMAAERGRHFDPELTDVFLEKIADVPEILDPESYP